MELSDFVLMIMPISALLWLGRRYWNVINSEKWNIEGINFNVYDIKENNVDGNREIIISGYILDNKILNKIQKIFLITNINNVINENTIKQIRELERNKEGYPYVRVHNSKNLFYYEIKALNFGKNIYLFWIPYEIKLKYIGNKNIHAEYYSVTLESVENDWNI